MSLSGEGLNLIPSNKKKIKNGGQNSFHSISGTVSLSVTRGHQKYLSLFRRGCL